jgi:hypothetical protein
LHVKKQMQYEKRSTIVREYFKLFSTSQSFNKLHHSNYELMDALESVANPFPITPFLSEPFWLKNKSLNLTKEIQGNVFCNKS